MGDREVRAHLFDANGAPRGASFVVQGGLTGSQSEPEVARSAGGAFVVVWQEEGDSSTEIFARQYDASGAALGQPFEVSTDASLDDVNPSVGIADNGDFVVVWRLDDVPSGSDPGIFMRPYSRFGAPLGDPTRVDNTADGGEPVHAVVAVDPASGEFVVVWSAPLSGSFEVFAQRFNEIGFPVGQSFQVNTHTQDTQSLPTVDITPGGDFVIAWRSRNQDGSGSGIYARRFADSGNPLGTEFRVNTTTTSTQIAPDIALEDGGNFLIAWESFGNDGDDYGIFGQRYGRLGEPIAGEFQISSTTAGAQQRATVALDGVGNGLVAWRSLEPVRGNVSYLKGQRFRRLPTPLEIGPEFVVDPDGAPGAASPALVGLPDGGFVVIWERWSETLSRDIYLRRFDAQAQPLTPPLLVSQVPGGRHGDPRVDAAPDGSFVVVWTEFLDFIVWARPYDAQAQPLADSVQVASDGYEIDVAATSTGFLVVWTDRDSEFVQSGFFAPDGTAQGPAADLTPNDPSSHVYPSVSDAPDGSFVAVWRREAAVYTALGQRIGADGVLVGPQLLLEEDDDFIGDLEVRHAASGEFAIGWEAPEERIVIRRYAANATPLGELTVAMPAGGSETRPALEHRMGGG